MQWCAQDQILKTKTAACKTKTKTKVTRPKPRPRPSEVNKGTWRIYLLSKWTPLLISTVVMFQAQNRETINSGWEVAVSLKIIMTMIVLTRPCFTTQHQTCQTKTDFFLVWDRSWPKTDGLRPHHLSGITHISTFLSVSVTVDFYYVDCTIDVKKRSRKKIKNVKNVKKRDQNKKRW